MSTGLFAAAVDSNAYIHTIKLGEFFNQDQPKLYVTVHTGIVEGENGS
ncbi:hypothetical protein DHEL01_v209866 [Diaporthe helianthi]|uniref:Uncharacterized protein n=1 Tax=Diaporthe helianthi TaxID=158607 RepID=A0A2P5HNA1_DIAHE|nr:hypothetical protein DHEL01_v209866 [Diaporthe helianthi]